MVRKTYRHKQTRRHTRKHGGACPCSGAPLLGQFGGRDGMGGADLGHAFRSQAYTTDTSQELYQMTGRTPGLSSGGSRASKKRRHTRLTEEANKRMAMNAERRAEEYTRRMVKNRHNKFGQNFVKGMPILGYEGNEYKHLSRNEMKNKIREEAISKYVHMFGNNEGFNELHLELNNNNNNMGNDMGNVIIPGNPNPYLRNLLKKNRK